MIPEKVFHQILALGEAWRVSRVDYLENEREVLIRVEETPAVWAGQQCSHCAGKSVGGYDHAPERQWRHLNVCQLESKIVCALPRGQCRDCGKVFTVRAPRGRFSSAVTAPPCFCTTKVTTLAAAARAKNGIFSVTKRKTVER